MGCNVLPFVLLTTLAGCYVFLKPAFLRPCSCWFQAATISSLECFELVQQAKTNEVGCLSSKALRKVRAQFQASRVFCHFYAHPRTCLPFFVVAYYFTFR